MLQMLSLQVKSAMLDFALTLASRSYTTFINSAISKLFLHKKADKRVLTSHWIYGKFAALRTVFDIVNNQ